MATKNNHTLQFEDCNEDLEENRKMAVNSVFSGIEIRFNESKSEVEEKAMSDDDFYEEDFYDEMPIVKPKSNPNDKDKSGTSFQPQEKVLRKFASKIKVEKYDGPAALPNHISTALSEHNKATTCKAIKSRDKSDRATVETVLDPRTRMILYKLLSRNIISEINGCISTGKEANVYHATCTNKPDLAVKIFKTSILTFKDRDR